MRSGFRTYLRVLATVLAIATVFPMAIVFVGLFFYDRFSFKLVAIHVGAQFVLFTIAYLIVLGVRRLWGFKREFE